MFVLFSNLGAGLGAAFVPFQELGDYDPAHEDDGSRGSSPGTGKLTASQS